MKVLITGGSGFLGRNLIERLLRDGHQISCLDRYEAPFLSALPVKMYSGDVFEKALVQEAAAGQDVVFHMACTVIPKTSNDDPYFDVMSNIGGAIHLLDAAVSNRVRKFVFISSGGTVYGRPEHLPIAESHPLNPECSYGITKLAVEKYLRLYRNVKGLPTCSLRLANPYGRYQRYRAAQGAVAVFCHRALAGEPIEIWGDGQVKRDFVYVEDAVDAMIRAMEIPDAVGEINVGSGVGTSLNQLIDKIEAAVGATVHRKYMPTRDFDVPVNYLDVARAKKMLGWKPVTSLEDGLRKTIDYIRSNMEG